MEVFPSTQEIVIRLGLSVILGGILGLERQIQRKPAGLRTHMMVSLGAAAFSLIAIETFHAAARSGIDVVRLDPTRLLQGLVGGLGFLGAGTIVHTRGSVGGLTTAASIWLTGAMGAACGGGHYTIAGISIGLALVILVAVGYLERRLGYDQESATDRSP